MTWLWLREIFQKTKWNFLMKFSMKGGGGSRVPLFCSSICCLKTSRITLWLPKRVLVIVWALYYVSIVVEVTLNSSEYDSHRTDQPENVNFEPITRGLKSDIFDWELSFGNVLLGSLSMESQCQEITFLWSQASSQYNFQWNILRTCDGQILYYHQNHRTAFNSTFHRKTIGKLFAFSSSHIYF